MSIKFACPHCQTKLSAREEKVGRKFRCPKCAEVIRVPAPEEVAVLQGHAEEESAESQSEVEELGDDPFAEFIVYDTEIVYETGDGPQFDSDSEEEGGERPAGAAIRRGTDYDRRFVAVRRSLLYVHGALLGLIALTALAAGFFIGSAVRPDPTRPPPQEPEIQPVVLEGKLQYEAITGSLDDKRAVVIALPEKVEVENKIAFARQFFNDATMSYNTQLQSFPTNVVAGVFRFVRRDFFEVAGEAERAAPKVAF